MSAAPKFRELGTEIGKSIAMRTISMLNAEADPNRVQPRDVGRRMGAELRAAEAELRENGASAAAVRSFSDSASAAVSAAFNNFRAGLDAATAQGRN